MIEEKSRSVHYERFLNAVFFIFLALIISTRFLVLFEVNIRWLDPDQAVMWAGLKDYASGKFYEPRFYGQDYNTFFEALVAVPFFLFHMPVYYALPIATHLLFLFPFVFTSTYLFRKKKKEHALLVLAMALCMPVGYDIMNGIPRGFVTGIFFCSFFVLSVQKPENEKFFFLNTLLAVLAYFVNPNSLLVIAPFMIYVFFHQYRKRNYYLILLCGLIFAILLHFFFNAFYKSHPSYIVLGLDYEFTPDLFWSILSSLDKSFAHVSLFTEGNCVILIGIFLLLGIFLSLKNKNAAFAFLGFLAVIFISFLSAKVKQGGVWPFYSYSRMYLGIPLVIGLLSSLLPLRSKAFSIGIVLLTLGFTFFKFKGYKDSVAYHVKEKHWKGMNLVTLKNVQEATSYYRDVCRKNKLKELKISNPFWLSSFVNYGGPVLHEDFPNTELSYAERRYWVREENKNKIFSRFAFLSIDYNLDKLAAGKHDFKISRLDDYGLFLIENNRLSNKEFLSVVRTYEGN